MAILDNQELAGNSPIEMECENEPDENDHSISMECESEPGETDHSISMEEELAKVTVTTPRKTSEVGHNSLFNLSLFETCIVLKKLYWLCVQYSFILEILLIFYLRFLLTLHK